MRCEEGKRSRLRRDHLYVDNLDAKRDSWGSKGASNAWSAWIGVLSVGAEVLVVTPTFFPELVGTPHYVTDLVTWLAEQDIDVRVVTAQPFYPSFERFPGYGWSSRHDEFNGVPIYRLPTIVPRRGRSVWRAANEANFLAQGLQAKTLRRITASQKVISVSAGTPETVILGRHLTQSGGRHLAIVHDTQSGLATELGMVAGTIAPLLRRFERRALQHADVIHVLSDEMAEVLRKLGVSVELVVSPPWVTITGAVRSPVLGNEPLVQYSGNLGRKQGVGQLVDLARRLREDLPNEKLLVRGDGSMRASLEAVRGEEDLTTMLVEPLVEQHELAAALARSPIHVVPQQIGCADYVLPSKVINALAVGSVVVAAAPQGSALRRLSQRTAAIQCVDPGDVDGMARKIVELAADRERLSALRADAASFAAANFERHKILTGLVSSLCPRASANDPEHCDPLDSRRLSTGD